MRKYTKGKLKKILKSKNQSLKICHILKNKYNTKKKTHTPIKNKTLKRFIF